MIKKNRYGLGFGNISNYIIIFETIPFYSVSFVSFSLDVIHYESQRLWD